MESREACEAEKPFMGMKKGDIIGVVGNCGAPGDITGAVEACCVPGLG